MLFYDIFSGAEGDNGLLIFFYLLFTQQEAHNEVQKATPSDGLANNIRIYCHNACN